MVWGQLGEGKPEGRRPEAMLRLYIGGIVGHRLDDTPNVEMELRLHLVSSILSLHLTFELWPTAHRFKAGHCLRLQISSGAHPRYARNTGSGEPLGSATKLLSADQAVYHDPEHPSGIVISVLP